MTSDRLQEGSQYNYLTEKVRYLKKVVAYIKEMVASLLADVSYPSKRKGHKMNFSISFKSGEKRLKL